MTNPHNRFQQGILLFAAVLTLTLNISAFDNGDYENALEMATDFFNAQRCGTGSNFHGACHTDDGESGVDLSGGWHDCGDHVKFGQTNGFSAAVLLHGYLTFPSEFDKGDYDTNIPDVLEEVKVYTDYALNTLDGSKLYYQVSYADEDHAYNNIPENDWHSRSVYSVSGSGATNIAGTNAAVLAMMYRAYKEFEPSYAEECLAMAKKMYAFGDAKHESIGSSDGTYDKGAWVDDIALGAVELYAATHDEKYKDAAIDFFASIEFSEVLPGGFVLDYSNVATLAAHSFIKHIEDKSSLRDKLKAEIDTYVASVNSSGQAFFEKWGSLKYTAGATYAALLAADVNINSSPFKTFAQSQIDFILGDHGNIEDASSGFSFLSGFGSSYPMGQLHHCAAAGLTGTDFGWWNSTSNSNKYDLVGALVGGPTGATEYSNIRSDYYTNEVCIYYNAPLVSALSGLLVDKKGAPNRAPTNIIISNTKISSGQPGGTVLGNLTTMDPDYGDSHTYSIITGGNDFSLNGNSVETKDVLTAGNITLKIKSTDGDGLSYEKEYDITVVDGGSLDNLLYDIGWFAYTNGYGSKVNDKDLDTSTLFKDGVLFANCKIIKEVPDTVLAPGDTGIWPGVTIGMDSLHVKDGKFDYENGSTISFSTVDKIILEYKTDGDFKLVLPMNGTGYDDYSKALTNTAGALTVDTIVLNTDNFKQEGWGTTVTFDKSKIFKFDIQTAYNNKTAYFELQTVVIPGIAPSTPITSTGFNNLSKGIALRNITKKNMSVAVPANGNYNISIFSLNGKLLKSIDTRMTKGNNKVNWNGANLGTGMAIIKISGNNKRFSSRLLLK